MMKSILFKDGFALVNSTVSRLALITLQYCYIILFRISPKRIVLCSQLLSLCQKKIIIPNSDNFGASSSEVALAAPRPRIMMYDIAV